MLRIDLHKPAVKFLDHLPPKHRRQAAVKISELARDPSPPDAAPLKGYPLMRADIGECRIVYTVIDDVLHVPLIGKRNDEVYRKLRRMQR